MKDKELRAKVDRVISELEYTGILDKNGYRTVESGAFFKVGRYSFDGKSKLERIREDIIRLQNSQIDFLENKFNKLLEALDMEEVHEPEKTIIRKKRKGKK
jgi:hypothetical protein